MRYLQRYLSLLFALVMCVGLFSVTAHAEEVEVDNYHVYVTVGYNNNGGSSGTVGAFTFYPNNGTAETKTLSFYEYAYRDFTILSEHTFATDENGLFVKKGRNVNITIENISDTISIGSSSGSLITSGHVTGVTLYAIYTDGTRETISADWDNKSNGVNVNASFTPQKDLDKMLVSLVRNIPYNSFKQYLMLVNGEYKGANVSCIIGEYQGDSDYKLTIERSSEEAGLLQGIGNKLSSGFSALTDGIKDVFNSIKELPSKLWEKIENGLRSLFIPEDGFMENLSEEFKASFLEKAGVIRQVTDMLTDKWDIINTADETNSIELPEATINFGETPFTFGGYTVQIVPNGFEWLATICKTLTGIVCTVLFVNGMRKKYEELVGVEK